ncbi:MAG: hypothetical protein H6739_30125 [Alphaproteobacteria bacterium]|nr:hypothetical protein [Alphaproteobacteria bacterium]
MLLLLLACATEPTPPPQAALAEPHLPSPDAPSLLEVEGDPALLVNPGPCVDCHAEQVAQWSASAHAQASFDNPWYRASVESFREERGLEESGFCGGCHDPALLADGAMDTAVAPDDPRALAGVGCLTCHGAVSASTEGNAALHLKLAPVPLPDGDDPVALQTHLDAVRPLDTPALCVSCHRGWLSSGAGHPDFMIGMDEGGPWAGGPWGGSEAAILPDPVAPQTCVGCHMAQGHRFPGGHTSMAAAMGDDDQLDAVRSFLREVVVIDIPVVWVDGGPVRPDAAALPPGASLDLDVTVRNQGVGHRFPGGLKDTQDTRVVLTVRDADGRVLAEAGGDDDPAAWRLAAGVLDEAGAPEHQHRPQRFRAPGWDHTIGPQDAHAVRYQLTLPDEPLALPLEVEVHLDHRRHAAPFHDAACADHEGPQGQAYSAAREAAGRAPMDLCAPQPVTRLAEATVFVGPDAPAGTGGAARDDWTRLRDHALGMRLELQEHVGDALPTIAWMDEVATDDRQRATNRWLEAVVLGRQGRTDEALAAADAGEALLDHPAFDRARGDALAQVWRWDEAVAPYARLTAEVPGDTQVWRDLARASASAGDPETALAAAARGLQGWPRDESLLRSQALALADLAHPQAQEAEDAWITSRVPDDTSARRAVCAREVEGCDQLLRPVPRISLELLSADGDDAPR